MNRYNLDEHTQELLDQILWYAADTADLQRDDRTRDHMLAQINSLAYVMCLTDTDEYLDDLETDTKPKFRLVVDNDKDTQ